MEKNSVRTYVRPSARKSSSAGPLMVPEALLAVPLAHLAGPQVPLIGPKTPVALRSLNSLWLALRHLLLALKPV